MPKWTKKDIKILCQTISTFWLINRPLGYSMKEHARALEEVRRALANHRAEIVIAGITELGGLAAERATKNQDAADHFRKHPNVYGQHTSEMIARFERYAQEDQKDVDKAKKLIARIVSEGLPPEVTAFDPMSS